MAEINAAGKEGLFNPEGLAEGGIVCLGDQIRRAVVSVPSNIAEGFGRGSDSEFNRFLSIARGSLFEVKTQLQLASELGFLRLESELMQLIDEVGKLIAGLSKTLTANR